MDGFIMSILNNQSIKIIIEMAPDFETCGVTSCDSNTNYY